MGDTVRAFEAKQESPSKGILCKLGRKNEPDLLCQGKMGLF